MPQPPLNWQRALALLDMALDMPPPQRDAWLSKMKGNPPAEDVAAFPLLQKLLKAHGRVQTHEILATLPKLQRAAMSTDGGTATEQAGLHIGPFELIEPLGRGGMGSVWRARYADGRLKRDVAIKLPASTDDPAALANLRERFARERDFLAQLQHPNIARLYDAGISDSGQPFLAMEYVAGKPIDTYCDEARLPVAARLKLFLQVLDAVAHAHQQLVLHRDLKPGNVLVDAQQQVRLLDFGVARLLPPPDAPDPTGTELTERAGAAFTLGYAAPEQINHGALSTATDVYALGVMLYRLLTGLSPYQPVRDTRGALEDAVLLATPDAASSRSFEADALHARQTTAITLRKTLRNDLDVILAKALKKNPAERYPTVAALADELRRHLAQQPISARADSWGYRARLFVARHRVAVPVSALAAVALIGTAGVATWQAQVSARNSALATKEAARANTVQKFFASLLSSADPNQNKNITPMNRMVLDQALADAQRDFVDSPQTHAQVLKQLGEIYMRLGVSAKVLEVQRKRVSLLQAQPNNAFEGWANDLVDAQIELAWALLDSQIPQDRAAMVSSAAAAHAMALKLKVSDRLLVRSLCAMADSHRAAANDSQALAYASQAVTHAEKTLESPHPDLALAYAQKGMTAARIGQFENARELLKKAIAIDTTGKGRNKVEQLETRIAMANIEDEAGNYLAAKNSALAAIDFAGQYLGEMEGTLSPARARAVLAALNTGEVEEASRLATRLLGNDLSSADSFQSARAHFVQGAVAMAQGQDDAAELSFSAAEAGLAARPKWAWPLATQQANLKLRLADPVAASDALSKLLARVGMDGRANTQEYSHAQALLGVASARLGHLEFARAAFEAACAFPQARFVVSHPERVRCESYRILAAADLSDAKKQIALGRQLELLTKGRSDRLALTNSLQGAVKWAARPTNSAGRFADFPLL